MNCRRTKRLIPLYAEGDLDSRRASEVAAHLDSCGRCNRLADEYKESQNWLRSCESPEFDEDLLRELKRSVLIQAKPTRHRWIEALGQQLRRRQVLALSSALLIVVGALLFYIYQSGAETGATLADKTPSRESAPDNPARKHGPKEAQRAGFQTARHAAGTRRPKIHRFGRSVLSQASNQPAPALDRALLQIDGAADLKPALRIEMQTSDPNIRIIWFAPQQNGAHQTKPETD
jgi:anti-sigma factor RsiW